MRVFRQALVLVLVCTLLAYGQGNSFDKIRYNGGTVATTVSPKDWDNRLTVTADLIKLELKDGQAVEIDPESVSGLSYGQEAHRRVGTMIALGILVAPLALFGLFHKTRLHFVGVEYTTAEGKPAGLLIQAHKNNYRAVLMALRGATGAPIAVAEEDRKYVPTGVEAVVVKSEEEQAEETKKAAKQEEARTGVVAVNSTPDAAEIWVDGAFVGNTPVKLTPAAGKHNIRVSLAGHTDWVRDVQVLPNSEVTLNAALVQL